MAAKQNSVSNMTTVYILIGVFFILLTGLNIYSYITIVGMSRTYAELGFVSRDFREQIQEANSILQEIVNGNNGKKLDNVWSILDRAAKLIPFMVRLEPSLSELDKSIEKFKESAVLALQEKNNGQKREQHLSACNRCCEMTEMKIKIFEDRTKNVIDNEMKFVRLIYIILLCSNVIVFGGMFFMVYKNHKEYASMAKKITNDNANFHAIMFGLDSVLLTIDNSGIIRNWNSNAETYFEKPQSSVLGKNVYETIPAFAQFKDFFNTVLYSAKRAYKYHERIIINKGPVRVADILCVPMLSAAFKKGYSELLIKIDDVTTYRLEEERKVLESRMNAARSTLRTFAAETTPVLSDIGESINSVNAIVETGNASGDIIPYTSYVETLMLQLSLTPQKYISSLTRSADNRIHIDLNEMIMYVLRICQKTFDPSIHIEVALNESKSWVLADPAMLAEVFLNIMDNASDAMTTMKADRGDSETGGILAVSIEKIGGEKIACDRLMRFRQGFSGAAYWVIIVSDTGVGIEPEALANIYEPFYTTKNNPLNKGLGLSHAQVAINALDGYIDVNTKPGRGTVFKIFLPESEETTGKMDGAITDSSLNADEKDIPHGEGLIILVNENNLMRKITRQLLEKIGYTVIDADNGYSALNLYAEHMGDVACVILDVAVPEMTNADIYLSLKAMNPDVQVIVMPDSDQDESSMKLRENGFSDFIRKPFSFELLAKTIQRMIAERSAV